MDGDCPGERTGEWLGILADNPGHAAVHRRRVIEEEGHPSVGWCGECAVETVATGSHASVLVALADRGASTRPLHVPSVRVSGSPPP